MTGDMTVFIGKSASGPGSRHRIRYGDETLVFYRLPRERDNGRILIKVHPDCTVEVRAPESASHEDVRAAVLKRARWITEKLHEFRETGSPVPAKRYISGESHFYLGSRHLLKVHVSQGLPESVKLLRGRFDIQSRSRDPEHLRGLMTHWYRERAQEMFSRRLSKLCDQALWLEEKPPLSIRDMQRQWGSCSPSGRLSLNLHLVKAPRDCIDYVILHELCHLAEHNHSDRFYRLMKQVMPEWETVKAILDSRAAEFLA